ncbi:4'-phosphopantetheinyl transferase superfamily protein [Paenibacillus chibensis]|uniref:4'-phosphopantetheinyl transferase superfamily protein n=1 Tax=Paenibacillus chibensis TaxID=59846 RepID=A0ABU6PU33_9BACL|nr:4'-phosphopantetheinyl transferase superfamily protein [Paenibacillus chibensis]
MNDIAAIYAVYLERGYDSAAFRQVLELLPDDVRRKAAKYRAEQDARRETVSAVLKRVVACERNGISLDQTEWIRGEYGKPSLKGYPNFHFNVSHAGDWVVCAVSTEGPIGVDVERIGKAEPEVAHMCFSHKEYEEWRGLPDRMRDESFYERWTLKESYLKAIGRGLSIPLTDVETENRGNCIYISCQGAADNEFQLSVLSFDTKYKLAVCKPVGDLVNYFQYYTIDEIMSRFLELTVSKY